ncbi:MAG: type II toxin-antitoxin system death-on-curing family toxin [Candidatus Saccharimonadales bacterium]|jgi:death-on-curing family protein
MKNITINEVENMAHSLAQKQMTWGEPIPEFGTRYPGKLESCLGSVFQTFGRKDLYPSLIDKAAILFYLLIKNHPFINGNKRIAVTSLLVFLSLNYKWLSASNEEMYDMALTVAKSSPKLKRGILELIKDFVEKNIIEYD